jgi:DNA-binding LytR/AlgR family response regulator
MLKIAICDDIPIVTSVLEQYIHEYKAECYRIEVFNTSQSLIATIESNEQFTIFFLDIEIDGNSGIDIAKIIRKYDMNAFIVFITSHKEYMEEVFQVHTFDYLLKPIKKSRIFEILDKVSNISNINKKQFKFAKNNADHYLPFGEIIFFEKQGRRTILHTKHGEFSFYMKTAEVLKQLDDQFAQIHTSYIINIKAISDINKSRVLLKDKNGDSSIELPISRKYKISVNNKILASFKRII